MLPQPGPVAVGVDRRTAKPYEYDYYYNTQLKRRWSYQISPLVLGGFLILVGILSFIWTCIDISRGALIRPLFQNPNNEVIFILFYFLNNYLKYKKKIREQVFLLLSDQI